MAKRFLITDTVVRRIAKAYGYPKLDEVPEKALFYSTGETVGEQIRKLLEIGFADKDIDFGKADSSRENQ